MGWNTYGKREKKVGGSLPVWLKVDRQDYSGGTIDIGGLSAGDVIPAGSMCYLDTAGGTLTIVDGDTASSAELEKVTGLLYNDVSIEEGDDYATGACVYEGNVYADRIPTVPDSVKAQLTQIRFTNER
jgi:hypothetical protein